MIYCFVVIDSMEEKEPKKYVEIFLYNWKKFISFAENYCKNASAGTAGTV